MPRLSRIDACLCVNERRQAPGAFHHVMCRGTERRRIFREDQDRRDFVDRLNQVLKETSTTCLIGPCRHSGRQTVGACEIGGKQGCRERRHTGGEAWFQAWRLMKVLKSGECPSPSRWWKVLKSWIALPRAA